MQRRLPVRRCVLLLIALAAIITLSLSALRSRGADVSRFVFLEHALHSSGGFHESHHDGTGGWVTRWFATSSQSSFLGSPHKQPSRQSRCPVYTYYDATNHHGSAVLQVWKRSFWALGFNPIVLSDKDAKKHSSYNSFRSRGLVGGSKSPDFGKWLVMSQRGGLFVDYRSIPMPLQHDPQFSNLRKCEFGPLTTYHNALEQVMHGSSQEYEKVVEALFKLDRTDQASMASEEFSSLFQAEASLEGIATYSEEAVAKLFPTVTARTLPSLINTHLHEHFLRTHSILAVLDPIENPQDDLLRRRTMSIAQMVASCPPSSLAGTCPPKVEKCKPCKAIPVKRIRTLGSLPEHAFVLGTVPHPLTMLSYVHRKSKLDPTFVRNTPRDDWLISVTSDVVDRRMGGYQRMHYLEDIISQSQVYTHSQTAGGYWQTWEESDWVGVEAAIGFQVGIQPAGGEVKGQDDDIMNTAVISAKERVLSQTTESIRDVSESWNLAWTELWYYVRALQRRQRTELLDLRGN